MVSANMEIIAREQWQKRQWGGEPVAAIEGDVRAVIDTCEWVAIATTGPDGPHLAATWGDYVRALGVTDEAILIPAGGLQQTQANLSANPRIELLFASREVKGSRGGPGKGCLVGGWAEVQVTGPAMETVKVRFPWARGVLVVHVERVTPQL
jgi:hypothetical protein